MTTAELYDLLYTTRAMMDQVLEFWLTASFAVVVASHFLAERLTRSIAALLSLAYSLFTFLLATRYAVTIWKTTEIRDRLLQSGEELSIVGGNVVGLLTIATFVVGYVSVLFFVRRSVRLSEKEKVES